MKPLIIALALLAPCPVLAAGDPVAGEAVFAKCQTCHRVTDDQGNLLAGSTGKTGPDLYRVIGRQAGSLPGFRFGPSITAAGAAGLIWDQATLADYVQDPARFLQARLGDDGARTKMFFKLTDPQAAADVAAFLDQIAQ